MRRIVRRSVQASSIATLITAAVFLGAGSSAATTAAAKSHSLTPRLLQSAWFWQNAYEQSNSPVIAPPPQNEPTGVPKGDLPVAYTGDPGAISTAAQAQQPPDFSSQSSKITLLAFALKGVPANALITSFKLSLTLDDSGGATNVNAADAPVIACLPTRSWSSVEGGDYVNEPPVDCATKAPATVSGSTYTFNIASVAQSWITDSNSGVALVNDIGNTQTPFQTVFKGAKAVKASMTWKAGPPVSAPPTTGGTTGGVPTGSGTTTTSGGGGPVSGGSSSGPVDLPPSGPTTGTTGSGGSAPQVAQPQPPTTNVAAAKTASAMPTGAFWWAAVVIALLLLFSSFILGDAAGPPAPRGTGRLDRALRDRTGPSLS